MELMTIDEMRECYKEDKKRFVKAIILHLYCYDVREGITAKLYDIDGDLDDPLEYAFFGLVLVPTRHRNSLSLIFSSETAASKVTGPPMYVSCSRSMRICPSGSLK